MTRVSDLVRQLCIWAPPELQMDFDNAGFLLGRGDAPVHRVLLALDITDAVVEEAVELGAELIVSHHPVIFHPLRQLHPGGEGGKILRLAEHGIAAVCMHTNLDIAQGGVNDVLLRLLGAEPEDALDGDGCGRIGTLPDALPLEAFLARCKERLGVTGLRYVAGGRPVHRLAVMGGAGGDAVEDAIAKGCDTYVTADVKYHSFLDAGERGLNLIDADHFCTENPVIWDLCRRLQAAFPELECTVSRVLGQTVRFF